MLILLCLFYEIVAPCYVLCRLCGLLAFSIIVCGCLLYTLCLLYCECVVTVFDVVVCCM